jgi:nucleoside-diphosphate-sugar epimerase
MTQHTLLITGAAGYVGAMLCEQFAQRPEVATILALDVAPCPVELVGIKKIVWIQANTADEAEWQARVAEYAPTAIIHAAWQIREQYDDRATQWRWNIEGSKRVFEYAFAQSSVRTLVHISTAAVYGAQKDNRLDHFFTEAEPPREDTYSYAHEKKQSEEDLKALYEAYDAEHPCPRVYMVRPSAITGPRGRYLRVRFGLQSALAGRLSGGVLNRIVSALTMFLPAPRTWARQFIHEDDVTDSIAHLIFTEHTERCAIYNITPPGEPILASEMARVVGKKVLPVHPYLVCVAFWVFWHLTRGRIPTARGVWRFYSYPILLDGTRITSETGYQYAYTSREALAYTDGRYAAKLAPADQLPNPARAAQRAQSLANPAR